MCGNKETSQTLNRYKNLSEINTIIIQVLSWHFIFLKLCVDATSTNTTNEKIYQSNQNISQLHITYTCTSKHTKKPKSLTVLSLQLHIYMHFGNVKIKINRVYLEKSNIENRKGIQSVLNVSL